ncbi:MAG: GNAT family N-acetyltransferase [Geminicoccaceae bacterium]
MISIRPATVKDAETLSRVLCGSIRLLCGADHKNDPTLVANWTANKTPEQMKRWVADPKVTIVLAERNGQAAGVGCSSSDGEILLNYVIPEHRFCGVSKAIMSHLEAALAASFVRSKLTSTETAHRFYRDAGWVDVGEPVDVFGLRGYPMEKVLRRPQ